jgi:hypothetical protein
MSAGLKPRGYGRGYGRGHAVGGGLQPAAHVAGLRPAATEMGTS